MTIGIAADHGGFELKSYIIKQFSMHPITDLGAFDSDRVDYPHFADKLCTLITSNKLEKGILICGTGIGISMRANRYRGIRAAVVHSNYTAEMAKAHNNANIICLGGRTTQQDDAITFVKTWLNTPFESGRHQTRIDLIDAPLV